MIDVSKKYGGEIIKSAAWLITYKCDYRCSYCFQRRIKRVDCDVDVVEKVLEFFRNQKEKYLVKLIGGEVFSSEIFFFICESLIKSGHKICIGTNMSASLKKFEELIELCGESLEFITASYHTSQVKDRKLFVDKAVLIKKSLLNKKKFLITSVVTEKNYKDLKCLEAELTEKGVPFKFQRLKENGSYSFYNEEIERELSDRWIDNSNQLVKWNSEGTICYAGFQFINIAINGDVYRCYNTQRHFNKLGNIADDSFRVLDYPLPCFSKSCTCTIPVNRGMIQFENKASPMRMKLFELKPIVKKKINRWREKYFKY